MLPICFHWKNNNSCSLNYLLDFISRGAGSFSKYTNLLTTAGTGWIRKICQGQPFAPINLIRFNEDIHLFNYFSILYIQSNKLYK